jgi:predicted small secreted protein
VRAPNIIIVAAASLSLAACSSVRTVNGVDIESNRKLCHGPVERWVLLGLAVVAAAGIGVALVSGLTKDRKEPRFFFPPPPTASPTASVPTTGSAAAAGTTTATATPTVATGAAADQ